MKNLNLLLLGLILFTQVGNAQWTSLGSGIDETPRAIWSLAIPDKNTIWAFTVNPSNFFNPVSEFSRSTDSGETWQAGNLDISSNLLVGYPFALDSLTSWLCTTDLANPVSGKLYKTTDGGLSWIHQSTAYTGFNESPTAVHFFDDNTGVTFGAQSNDDYNDQISIYTTTDGGDMWTKVTTPNIPTQLSGEGMTDFLGSSIYAVVDNTIWFPTLFGRVFKSENKGLTWEVFETGLQGTPRQEPISIAMQDSLVGILVSPNPNEVVKTIDGGETWVFIDLPASTTKTSQVKYIPGTLGTYLIHDAFDSQSTKVFITNDAGATWEIIETNVSLFCAQFISPTVGYGGGNIINSETGGIYTWEGSELVSTKFVSDSKIGIELSPNPVTDNLRIQFPINSTPELITIRDNSGTTLYAQEIPKGFSEHSYSTKNLPSGVYYLGLLFEDKYYIKKFVKINN